MDDLRKLEAERQKGLSQIESTKEKKERSLLGQFPTPIQLSDEILEVSLHYLENNTIEFLDPAAGSGTFFSSLLRIYQKPWSLKSAIGFEIDPDYANLCNRLWGPCGMRAINLDFTKKSPDTNWKSNLLVCNPPYSRHQFLTFEEKERLQQMSEQFSGVKPNKRSGLYTYFLLISDKWLDDGGIGTWIIPAIFMDSNYGQSIRKYLTNNVTLLRIHKFDPEDNQFDRAVVPSAVVWFKKAPPPRDFFVDISYMGRLNNPIIYKHINISKLISSEKWSIFFTRDNEGKGPPMYSLSDFFEIKRGLATGANKYFILTAKEIKDYDLSMDWFTPILPSPRHLKTDEIHADSMLNPIIENPHFLLNIRYKESMIAEEYPSLWNYIQDGVTKNVDKRFLCARRTPWFSQESREPAPFMIGCMGSSGDRKKNPFRLILNHSRALAANSYILLYPRGVLKDLLVSEDKLKKEIWNALKEIPSKEFIDEGRAYGGGLHKIEPRELSKINATLIYETIIAPRQKA